MMTDNIEDIRTQIRKEILFIGVKPYSHNIIGILLSELAKHGSEEANKAIDDFGLEYFGWRKTRI